MPDYAFYQAWGGSLSEADFLRLRARAWAYLDGLTLGRVNRLLPGPSAERVKRACCAVADEYAAQEQGGAGLPRVDEVDGQSGAVSGGCALAAGQGGGQEKDGEDRECALFHKGSFKMR